MGFTKRKSKRKKKLCMRDFVAATKQNDREESASYIETGYVIRLYISRQVLEESFKGKA